MGILSKNKSRNVFSSNVFLLPVNNIRSKHVDPPEELVKSISRNGLLQPVMVLNSTPGFYILVEGRKRLEAAKKLGLQKVPAVCFSVPGDKKLEFSKWCPGTMTGGGDASDRTGNLLREAEHRGIIKKEDYPRLELLGEEELISELKRLWNGGKPLRGSEVPRAKTKPPAKTKPRAKTKPPAKTKPTAKTKTRAGTDALMDSSVEESENGESSRENPVGEKGEDVRRAMAKVSITDGGNQKALNCLKKFFASVSTRGRIVGVEAERVVQFFLKLRQNDPHNFLSWKSDFTLKSVEKHSLLVMKACIHMALSMEWTRLQVIRFGVAGLLHDVGLVSMEWDPEAVEVADGDSIEEPPEHVDEGCRMVQEARAWGLQIQSVCSDHHERWDGSGFPMGKKNEEVDLPARIISLLDSFILMVSPFVGEGISPHEAMERMRVLTDEGRFDPDVFNIFLAHFSEWPIGSLLRLNDGKIVQVVGPNMRNPSSPRLKILEPEDRNRRFAELRGSEQVSEDLTMLKKVLA